MFCSVVSSESGTGAAAYKKYCTKSMRDYVVPVHHADIEKFRKLKPAETEAQKAAASSKCYMECLCAALAPACHNTAPGSRYALPMPTDHGCIERERERELPVPMPGRHYVPPLPPR